MLNLNHLLKFKEIIIQCHDNPDADALASGYALYIFFKHHKKNVRLIYGGAYQIVKPNLKLMTSLLHIPIEHVTYLDKPDLLITVDCQYGEGNVYPFEASSLCILDHHIPIAPVDSLCNIQPFLASCSTLIWSLLMECHFNLSDYPLVSTALYYGLLTDSNSFTEISHSLDIAMQNTLIFDFDIIRQLKYSNLTLLDLAIAGRALIHSSSNLQNKFSLFKSEPCDPNILGFISDLAIQVDSITLCIVYFEDDSSIKYSIRSCSEKILANEVAKYLCKNIGTGGGHIDKAGGRINLAIYKKYYPALTISDYFTLLLNTYLSNLDILNE